MIPSLGRGLILVALLFAAGGATAGWYAATRGTAGAWRFTRNAAAGFTASMIAANLLMVYALVTDDFSVSYVAEVGSRATPRLISVISLWASLSGSILFWGGILAVYMGAFLATTGRETRARTAYTLHVFLAVAVFFTMLVASVADPFAPVASPLLDGPGPNPLLQNHWLMAIHPPALYLGYVGMTVPFAMLCGALLDGRLESGWIAHLRRWMLVPWGFLTLGVVLGGAWSYAVLGWGGYWAWYPVENASLHPWLTATAFLHSAMVLERHRKLLRWTVSLGLVSFLLTLIGTFMTRSGVFNSVHSFTQSDIGPVFLGFLGVAILYSVALVAIRIPVVEAAESGKVKPPALGREAAILFQNVCFTALTFTVLLGTLYPLVAEGLGGRRVSVGEPYFDRFALPLGVAIVFLMGVGPALPWGNTSPAELRRRLGPPALGGIAAAGIAAALGFVGPWALLTIGMCGFALVANAAGIVQGARLRTTRRALGGRMAHAGMAVLVVALALSKGWKHEVDLTLGVGEVAEFEGYTLRFTGARRDVEPHRTSLVARFEATRNGRAMAAQEPRMNHYDSRREPIGTPAVHTGLAGDLYLSILAVPDSGQQVTIRAMTMPGVLWLWVGSALVCLGGAIAVWPARRAAGRATSAALAGEPA